MKELDRRHQNKFKNPKKIVEKLHNECGPCAAALLTACQNLKAQIELAGADDPQNFSISEFSDDLLLSLANEKNSVENVDIPG